MSNLQFKKDLEHGKIGEKWFQDYCMEKGFTCINVGEDSFLGIEAGIDFIAENKKGNVAKFDVKFDSVMHLTGNMFIELFQDKNKEGWFYKSKANKYCYIDEINKILYIFNKKMLNKYIEDNSAQCKQITCRIDGRQVTGKLVNIEQFSSWCEQNGNNADKVILYRRP